MATPLMEQYSKIKAQHPSDILLFRLGDFYEMFYEDAKIASKVLGIVLTWNGKLHPLVVIGAGAAAGVSLSAAGL